MSRGNGLRGPGGDAEGSGAWFPGRAESRVRSGAGVGSGERTGYPENSTCPWGVGLRSEA